MTKQTHSLSAEKRNVSGRKVKQLRKQDILPANIFGSKVDSLSIQIPAKDFAKTYQETGDTGLIDLTVQGESKTRPILVHKVQSHPVSGQLLHVDLRQVDLKAKITAEVPVDLIGESEAVHQGGVLTHPLTHIEVEALPTDFPEKFEVDISKLAEIGDTLHVSDIKVDTSKLTLMAEPDEVVAKVEAQQEEEEEETPVTEVEGEAKEGETKEGEGDGKKAEGSEEKKDEKAVETGGGESKEGSDEKTSEE